MIARGFCQNLNCIRPTRRGAWLCMWCGLGHIFKLIATCEVDEEFRADARAYFVDGVRAS